MVGPATTKMSSKGQIVIPESIRLKLGFKAGSEFIVLGDKGVLLLKEIEPPSMAEFDELITEARKQARKARLKRSDVAAAVKAVRKRK